MSETQTLAELREKLDRRTAELDEAIAKLNATPRDAEEYGTVYKARWTANEAYNKAWEDWYEASDQDCGATSLFKSSNDDNETPQPDLGIPVSFEQAVTEASQISQRLGYLLGIIRSGGPTFGNSDS